MKQRLLIILAWFALCCVPSADAGTISGQIQTATGGSVVDGTLTFTLSQAAVLSGTATIVPSPVACYTDNFGNIVGLPDPLVLPITSTNLSSGTLPAGTYYVKIAYFVGSTYSNVSKEAVVNLSNQGTLIVSAPVLQPASATGYTVYIGATSGSETLQGTVTGWGQYPQSTNIVSGATPPASNTTVCSIAFSDQLIPTGTHYTVNFINANASRIAGFPQTWCTYGGASGTINVSQGTPTGNCGSNGVFYPTPVQTTPASQGQQSILGPLQVQSLSCTGTPCGGIPLWPIVSNTANPAQSGQLRFANIDKIAWRNASNSGDLPFGVNSSNNLIFNSSVLPITVFGRSGPAITAANNDYSIGQISGFPSQTGQSGKFITTNGSTLSFTSPPGGGNVTTNGFTAPSSGRSFLPAESTTVDLEDSYLVQDVSHTGGGASLFQFLDFGVPSGGLAVNLGNNTNSAITIEVTHGGAVTAGTLAKQTSGGWTAATNSDGGIPVYEVIATSITDGNDVILLAGYNTMNKLSCSVSVALGNQVILDTANAPECTDGGAPGTSLAGHYLVGTSQGCTGSGPYFCEILASSGGGGGSAGGALSGSAAVGSLPIMGPNTTTIGTSNESEASNTFISAATNGMSATQYVSTAGISQYVNTSVPNASTGGTTALLLSKITTSGAVIATTSDTAIRVYATTSPIASVTGGCTNGTTGNACLVVSGEGVVTADSGGITAGHYVGASTVTGGDVIDIGTSYTAGVYCLGYAPNAIAAGFTGTIEIGNCPAPTAGGSMTWPAGGAGIPNYNGSSAWGTSYSASSKIPLNFLTTITSAAVDSSVCSNAACGQNTTGTASNLTSGSTPSLPNGTAATTQSATDNSTKLATDAFVQTAFLPLFSTPQTAVSLTSGTGNLGSSVSMVTPSADGTYRFAGEIIVTTAGVTGTCNAGSVGVQLSWKDADTGVTTSGTANVMFQNGAAVTGTTIGNASVGANAVGATFYTVEHAPIRAKSGTAIAYQLYETIGSNCTTVPVITFRPALWYLGY